MVAEERSGVIFGIIVPKKESGALECNIAPAYLYNIL
jgi:hypothetical protein